MREEDLIFQRIILFLVVLPTISVFLTKFSLPFPSVINAYASLKILIVENRYCGNDLDNRESRHLCLPAGRSVGVQQHIDY